MHEIMHSIAQVSPELKEEVSDYASLITIHADSFSDLEISLLIYGCFEIMAELDRQGINVDQLMEEMRESLSNLSMSDYDDWISGGFEKAILEGV